MWTLCWALGCHLTVSVTRFTNGQRIRNNVVRKSRPLCAATVYARSPLPHAFRDASAGGATAEEAVGVGGGSDGARVDTGAAAAA